MSPDFSYKSQADKLLL